MTPTNSAEPPAREPYVPEVKSYSERLRDLRENIDWQNFFVWHGIFAWCIFACWLYWKFGCWLWDLAFG